MKLYKNFLNFIINSGINIESGRLTLFCLNHGGLMRLFRFKLSPLVLLKLRDKPRDFSEAISLISVGPAFKSTGEKRHQVSDELLLSYLNKFPNTSTSIADIGSSDGFASFNLWGKLKEKNVRYRLFDKFNYLYFHKTPFGHMFFNDENRVVYFQFLCFLFFIYPFDWRVDENKKAKAKKIFLGNPKLKELGLELGYFDVFESKTESPFNIIKCANLLTLRYFSPAQNIKGLKNMLANLTENGLLFIIHNNNAAERVLLLKKKSGKFEIMKNHNYDEYVSFLENTDLLNEKNEPK